MKTQEILFRKPIKILQIFRNINVYGKEDRSFEQRKEKLAWQPISSIAGYIKDDELYLPESLIADPKFPSCELITLEDDNHLKKNNPFRSLNPVNGKYEMQVTNQCFQLSHPRILDIFEISLNNKLELWLHSDESSDFTIGLPKRESFKLCAIEKEKPISIKINGKTDFSMSSRRARVFREQEYIFHYIGDFSSCKLLKLPIEPVIKHSPTPQKVVDLMRPLW